MISRIRGTAADEEAEEVVLVTKIPQRLTIASPTKAHRNPHHLNRLNWRRCLSQFHGAILRLLRIFTDAVILILGTIAKSGKNPSQRARTKPGKRARNRGKRLGRQKRIEDASRIASFSLTGLWSAKLRPASNQQDTLRPRYLDIFWWGTPKHPLSFW